MKVVKFDVVFQRGKSELLFVVEFSKSVIPKQAIWSETCGCCVIDQHKADPPLELCTGEKLVPSIQQQTRARKEHLWKLPTVDSVQQARGNVVGVFDHSLLVCLHNGSIHFSVARTNQELPFLVSLFSAENKAFLDSPHTRKTHPHPCTHNTPHNPPFRRTLSHFQTFPENSSVAPPRARRVQAVVCAVQTVLHHELQNIHVPKTSFQTGGGFLGCNRRHGQN